MFNRRLLLAGLPAVLYFAALFLRLFSMQVVDAGWWREEAARLSRRTVRVPARRGSILDRAGEVLVEDRFELDLTARLDRLDELPHHCVQCGLSSFATPGRTPRRCPACSGRAFSPGPRPDLSGLVPFLPADAPPLPKLLEQAWAEYREEVDEEIARRLKLFGRAERDDVERVLLRRERLLLRDAGPDLVREVSLSPERYHGVEVRPAWRRVSPADDVLGSIVGKTGPLSLSEGQALRDQGRPWSEIWRLEAGRSGLEKGLEERLRAREGQKEVDRDARGRVIAVLSEEPPVDGETVRSSLSLALQRSVTEALRTACRENGAEGGAFVALDPSNGEILVLASFGEGIYAHLNLSVLPAVPGSTFKILTAAAGLESGSIDPGETFLCDGPWHRIGCSHDHGAVALREAISGSCNKYFANAAERMGIGVMAPFARKLGFGRTTGLPLPEEAAGLVPDPEWKRRRYPADPTLHIGEVRQMGFGSGALLVTPLQIAVLMAAVANGGRLLGPTLVLGDGKAGDRVLSDLCVALVRDGMEAVVTEGTGCRLGLEKFRTAGKTGTAEVVADRAIHMAWFAGFAPAEAPRVAFACYLRRVSAYGAEAAGPIVASFLGEYFAR